MLRPAVSDASEASKLEESKSVGKASGLSVKVGSSAEVI